MEYSQIAEFIELDIVINMKLHKMAETMITL